MGFSELLKLSRFPQVPDFPVSFFCLPFTCVLCIKYVGSCCRRAAKSNINTLTNIKFLGDKIFLLYSQFGFTQIYAPLSDVLDPCN